MPNGARENTDRQKRMKVEPSNHRLNQQILHPSTTLNFRPSSKKRSEERKRDKAARMRNCL
eukprot:2320793-Prymnesium_polylepis.1